MKAVFTRVIIVESSTYGLLFHLRMHPCGHEANQTCYCGEANNLLIELVHTCTP
jgi:hypothetical protein